VYRKLLPLTFTISLSYHAKTLLLRHSYTVHHFTGGWNTVLYIPILTIVKMPLVTLLIWLLLHVSTTSICKCLPKKNLERFLHHFLKSWKKTFNGDVSTAEAYAPLSHMVEKEVADYLCNDTRVVSTLKTQHCVLLFYSPRILPSTVRSLINWNATVTEA
jgi:hypothetical protein